MKNKIDLVIIITIAATLGMEIVIQTININKLNGELNYSHEQTENAIQAADKAEEQTDKAIKLAIEYRSLYENCCNKRIEEPK